jgi:hypothetical protein
MKFFYISILTISFCLTGCKSNDTVFKRKKKTELKEGAEIEFTVLKNYFVKNNAPQIDDPKIETEQDFNDFFGMATTMSEEGIPTKIDFSKKFVITVILPETEIETRIETKKLIKDKSGNLTLLYKVTKGERQSFVHIPFIAIQVDNKEKGNVILKGIN